MSLINQVLKDLTQRKLAETAGETGINSLQLNPHHRSFALPRSVIFIFIMATLFFIGSFFHPAKTVHVPNLLPLAMTHVPIVPLSDTPPLAVSTPSILSPAVLTGIALQIQKETTSIGLLLNHPALYRIVANPSQETLTIVLDHAKLIASLPALNYANSAIKNIRAVNDVNGNLKIILSLNAGVELNHLGMNNNAKFPELQIDLFYKEASLSSASLEQARLPEKKVVVDLANDDLYQQAMMLSKAGQFPEAIDMLHAVLRASPGFTEARELLIMLLIKQNKKNEATIAIEKGLQQKPYYPPYIQLKAHLLVDQGKIVAAVNLLRSAAPLLNHNPEYYAFIAALYQRLGKFTFAEQVYQQLVDFQPANGLYWAGLGISLDKLGKRTQALDAFAKAEQLGNLSPELKSYLESN